MKLTHEEEALRGGEFGEAAMGRSSIRSRLGDIARLWMQLTEPIRAPRGAYEVVEPSTSQMERAY